MPVGIIDMGTNTFHLLVADVSREPYYVLHSEKTGVKLGEKGINHGILTEAAMLRALQTLKLYGQKAQSLGVLPHNITAIATSAVRNAANRNEFINLILSEAGINVQVIDGLREAELIYKGVRSSGAIGNENALVLDIGGGSVECIICNNQQVIWKQSFEAGGQRLLEKFMANDPILPSEIASLEQWLDDVFMPLYAALEMYKPQTLVGSSGSFDTLMDMYNLARQGSSLQVLNQASNTLPLQVYQQLASSIISSDRAGRMAMPGMIALRVDMIVVALCLVNRVFQKANFDLLQVSTYALKEGVLSEIIAANKI